MNKFLLALTVAVTVLFVAHNAIAKEETVIVGYIQSTEMQSSRDSIFREMDLSKDGYVNFKEFQRAAMLLNEYETFNMNDTNGDDLLSIDEYRYFSKSGPVNFYQSQSLNTHNFNKRPSH